MASTVPQLIANLKDEVHKIAKLSFKEYYICCSKELSPQKVDEIFQLFPNYMGPTANNITLNEIDDFLNVPENIEILKKHYKLWIESTGSLQEIGNTNVFIDCETILADIESEKYICKDLHSRFDKKKITHQEWCDLTAQYFVARGMNKSILMFIADGIAKINGLHET